MRLRWTQHLNWLRMRCAAGGWRGNLAQYPPDFVEEFRQDWLGRKQGRLNEVSSRWLKAAPPEAKKALGERFNALKAVVEGLLERLPERAQPMLR